VAFLGSVAHAQSCLALPGQVKRDGGAAAWIAAEVPAVMPEAQNNQRKIGPARR